MVRDNHNTFVHNTVKLQMPCERLVIKNSSGFAAVKGETIDLERKIDENKYINIASIFKLPENFLVPPNLLNNPSVCVEHFIVNFFLISLRSHWTKC